MLLRLPSLLFVVLSVGGAHDPKTELLVGKRAAKKRAAGAKMGVDGQNGSRVTKFEQKEEPWEALNRPLENGYLEGDTVRQLDSGRLLLAVAPFYVAINYQVQIVMCLNYRNMSVTSPLLFLTFGFYSIRGGGS